MGAGDKFSQENAKPWLDRLVAQLRPDRTGLSAPLFDSMLVVQGEEVPVAGRGERALCLVARQQRAGQMADRLAEPSESAVTVGSRSARCSAKSPDPGQPTALPDGTYLVRAGGLSLVQPMLVTTDVIGHGINVPASTVQGGVGAILRHTGTAPAVPGRG